MRPFPRPALVASLWVAGCLKAPDAVSPDSPLASEARLLERQVVSLRQALADSKRGTLFPPDHLAVGVSEAVVQSLVAQALPIERPIASRFMARIDRANVSFAAMQGAVKLEGRIWSLANPSTFAELTLMGGIEGVEIERATGILKAEIALDGFEVKRAAAMGAEADLVTEAARLLGQQGLGALRDLVPPIRIPVGVEQEVDLPGVSEGPILIPAGRLPLEARVSRVLPLAGKLWVMISVTTPGWSPARVRPPAPAPPAPSKAAGRAAKAPR